MTTESQGFSGRVSNTPTIAHGIANMLACEYMAAPDQVVRTGVRAWLSCQTADLPSHQNEPCRALHKKMLAAFAAAYAEWRGA